MNDRIAWLSFFTIKVANAALEMELQLDQAQVRFLKIITTLTMFIGPKRHAQVHVFLRVFQASL